jgi:hypothetical protein
MAATSRGKYRFAVKEGASGPWLAAESAGKRNPRLDGVLGLELRPETTIKEARNLAKILNEHVVAISVT